MHVIGIAVIGIILCTVATLLNLFMLLKRLIDEKRPERVYAAGKKYLNKLKAREQERERIIAKNAPKTVKLAGVSPHGLD
jgi:hypothetical protein